MLSIFKVCIISTFSLFLSMHFSKKIEFPQIEFSKQDTQFNFSKDIVNFFNLGNKRLFSSLLWIQTLLDSDHVHYNKKDLNNWMFLRFKTISEIEPEFYLNYEFGGAYLSVIKDDIPGASYIYEKGAQYFPKAYNLNFLTSIHFMKEVKDYKKASFYLDRIKTHPSAPKNLISLLAKINIEAGIDNATTLEVMKEAFFKMNHENPVFKKFSEEIYMLQAEVDLECLNSKEQKKCPKKDFWGMDYIFKNNKWNSKFQFKEVKLHKN